MGSRRAIPGSDKAWESGKLGGDDRHVTRLSAEQLAADVALIRDSLGLRPISIRLEKTLIDDFRTIARIKGIGYQTLMRQALKRFAKEELERQLVGEIASEIDARRTLVNDKHKRGRARD